MNKLDSSHATLRDVAKLAGVSIKTVSRVVNNQGEISESTRRRVQAAIDRAGYRPNILARNLVNRRTDTLAIVAWGIDLYGPSRTVLGIEQQSNESGYSLMLNLLPEPDHMDVEKVLDGLTARQVDGIVWAVPEVAENRLWIQPNRLRRLPPIVFLSMQPKSGLSVVAVDNRLGAIQATKHLIDQGRRTIGLITGPLSWWEARERYAGWNETLVQAGLTPRPSLVAEGDWSAISGERCMQKLLAQQPDIDAVFASNDQMALGALGVVHRLGWRVPQDLMIIGFDDIPESTCFWPPLTTVHQPLMDVGRMAVQQLHQIIEMRRQSTEVEPRATIISPNLVIRASSLLTIEPASSLAITAENAEEQ